MDSSIVHTPRKKKETKLKRRREREREARQNESEVHTKKGWSLEKFIIIALISIVV